MMYIVLFIFFTMHYTNFAASGSAILRPISIISIDGKKVIKIFPKNLPLFSQALEQGRIILNQEQTAHCDDLLKAGKKNIEEHFKERKKNSVIAACHAFCSRTPEMILRAEYLKFELLAQIKRQCAKEIYMHEGSKKRDSFLHTYRYVMAPEQFFLPLLMGFKGSGIKKDVEQGDRTYDELLRTQARLFFDILLAIELRAVAQEHAPAEWRSRE